jgi:hypothetical protein
VRSHSKAASARSVGHSRFGAALLASLTLVLLCGLFATSVQAATVYRFAGEEFGTHGSGESEVDGSAEGAVVDDQSGYALIPVPGSNIGVFETSGTSTEKVGSFGEGKVLGGALAIDQAERVVYANSGGEIQKYDISGSGLPTFTRDTSFTSPSGLSGDSRIAVDPTTGDLLTASRFGGQVNRYESDGTPVGSFNGAGSPGGPFTQIYSLAVDATGSVYVVDVKTNLFFENAHSVVERFAADGTPDPSFAPGISTPQSVAVDLSSGNVIVIGRSDGVAGHPSELFPVRMYTIHGDQIIDELDFPARNESALVALGVGGGASGHLYAPTKPGFFGRTIAGAYALQAFKVPDVHLDPVGAVTTFTAQLSGSANPVGQESTYHFEYSREGGPPQSTETLPLGEGEASVPLSAELTDLAANSEYEVRLVATVTSTGATVASAAQHFTTPIAPPRVVTGDAIDRMNTSATLLGTVNPFGQQTHYRFEYGPTASYGQQQPVDHDDVAGGGREPEAVHAYLSKLNPGTEYHYRLVAENATGVSFGDDRTFVTLGPPDRFYEQVTPVQKGGSEVNGLRIFYATPNGEGLLYQWKTAPQDGPAGPAQPRGFSWRGSDDWSSLALEPQQLAGTPVFSNIALSYVFGISDDGTKVVGVSLKALAPGAHDGDTNLYLEDTRTGAYTTMASYPGTEKFAGMLGLGASIVVDGTPDYSRILLRGVFTELVEGEVNGSLYEWHEGDLNLVSISPQGGPLGSVNAGGTSGQSVHDPHYISSDGSKIFFESLEGGAATYVRIDGQETVKIGGNFAGATSDGHYAFVYGTELTPDSEPGMSSMYRFDTETRQLELLTAVGAPLEANLQVSGNGASDFFSSSLALAPGAHAGGSNLYVWHEGEVQLVATEHAGFPAINAGAGYVASANGRYFAFASYAPLTGYDNRSKTACVEFNNTDPGSPESGGVACPEIFRYDVDAKRLSCASCPRDGARANGRARITTDNVEGDFSFNRAMLDDGTVVFDTTQALSSRDVNSNTDVYAYDGTEQTLISAGENNVSSQVDGASADGRDIFFTTQDRLVRQDTDSLADVYDARIGGGLPKQNPLPPRGECIRDDCKATPGQGPELPFGGSEALNGPENVHDGNARKRCGKGREARRVKGKSRCVKRRSKNQHRKQANSNRRQGR